MWCVTVFCCLIALDADLTAIILFGVASLFAILNTIFVYRYVKNNEVDDD